MLKLIGKGWFYTALSILTMLLTIKMIAVFLGPQGVAVFSVLDRCLKVLVVLGTFGGRMPLVQGLSSVASRDIGSFLGMAALLYLASSLCVALILYVFAQDISALLLPDLDPDGTLFRMMIPVMAIAVFANFYMAILNGRKKLVQVYRAQWLASLLMLVSAYPVIVAVMSGRSVAFLGVFLAAQTATLIYALYHCYRIEGWSYAWRPRLGMLKTFSSFSLMVFLGALIGQGGILFSRLMVIEAQGLVAAGYLEAAWAISSIYIAVVLNAVVVYYLPKVSGEQSIEQRHQAISQVLQLLLLIAGVAISLMLIFKPLIVSLLYTPAFYAALPLIQWMLLGELAKIIGWSLNIPLLGSGKGAAFLLLNATFLCVYLLVLFLGLYVFDDLVWAGVAYLIASLVYCVASYVLARRALHFHLQSKDIWMIALSTLVIVCVSLLSWNDAHAYCLQGLLPLAVFLLLYYYLNRKYAFLKFTDEHGLG